MSAILKFGQNRLGRLEGLAKAIDSRYSQALSEREDVKDLIDHTKRVTNIPLQELLNDYLPDFCAIEDCLGYDFCHSRWNGFGALPALENHVEISLYVALRTLETLNYDGKWKIFSGRPGDVLPPGEPAESPERLAEIERNWRKAWLKSAFRCAISVPIGYLVSHTRIRGGNGKGPSWSPTVEDLDDYVRRWGSVVVQSADSFRITPKTVSALTHTRLFGFPPSDIPMLALCEADFFRDKPNPENPIAHAFHDALKHVFFDQIYSRIPYWWVILLNHHFLGDKDYEPILYHIPPDQSRMWRPLPRIVSRDAASSDAAPSDEPPGTVEKYAAETQSNEQASFLIQSAVSVCHSMLSSGEYKVNTGGALFQSFAGTVYVVVPLFFRTLAVDLKRPGVSADTLHQQFVDDGLLAQNSVDSPETTFAIVKQDTNKRLGKVRGLPLSPRGVAMIFPDDFTYDDNPDLQPLRS